MTQQDIYLVVGVVLIGFSLPSIFGAIADRRKPLVGLLVLLIGGGLIGYAYSRAPNGITFADIPEAFIHLVAYLVRL